MWFCFTQLGLLNLVIRKHRSNQFCSSTRIVKQKDMADLSSLSEVLVQSQGVLFCSRNKIHL